MRLVTLFLVIVTLGPVRASDWGPTGHRAVGQIAEEYLSAKAKLAIDSLLGGQSLAWVSTFGDEIKSDTNYRQFYPWHYVNYNLDESYEDSEKNPFGDVIQAIDSCIHVLKDANATVENKSFYLKMLVHFMGDVHQPMHLGQAEDKGGNDIQVRWFNDGSNLHRVWDEGMIEYYNMSYTELSDNRVHLSYQQIDQIQQGELMDWVRETRVYTPLVYNSVEIGQKLRYKYHYDYFPIVLEQIHKAGLRLAKILNDIYG